MKYFLAIVLALILAGIFFAYWSIYVPVNEESAQPVVFLVKKGETLSKIAENLQEQGLIKNKYFFIAYAVCRGKAENLMAGQYEFSKNMAVPRILEKIYSGDRLKKTITIIEGSTLKDIEDYLGMGSIDPSLEGYLFPDTYEVYPDDKLEDIVRKMQDNFNEKTKTLNLGQRSLSDIVKMASILEKEVITGQDQKIVAGILWKRIKANMPLQVDAEPGTYKYLGLPEKPICNPGLQSIEAAAYPDDSKYWFYLSTPDGQTVFSVTLAEHEEAIRKYLK